MVLWLPACWEGRAGLSRRKAGGSCPPEQGLMVSTGSLESLCLGQTGAVRAQVCTLDARLCSRRVLWSLPWAARCGQVPSAEQRNDEDLHGQRDICVQLPMLASAEADSCLPDPCSCVSQL